MKSGEFLGLSLWAAIVAFIVVSFMVDERDKKFRRLLISYVRGGNEETVGEFTTT